MSNFRHGEPERIDLPLTGEQLAEGKEKVDLFLLNTIGRGYTANKLNQFADQPKWTGLLTKEEIAKIFRVGKNEAGTILDSHEHKIVGKKYRLRLCDMPPDYLKKILG